MSRKSLSWQREQLVPRPKARIYLKDRKKARVAGI